MAKASVDTQGFAAFEARNNEGPTTEQGIEGKDLAKPHGDSNESEAMGNDSKAHPIAKCERNGETADLQADHDARYSRSQAQDARMAVPHGEKNERIIGSNDRDRGHTIGGTNDAETTIENDRKIDAATAH